MEVLSLMPFDLSHEPFWGRGEGKITTHDSFFYMGDQVPIKENFMAITFFTNISQFKHLRYFLFSPRYYKNFVKCHHSTISSAVIG